MSERNPTGLPKQADVIQPGDVVLDLAQGRPMQVIERAADSVEEWVAANDYDLLGNYGNSRLGASVGDPVYTCVYTGNLRSEPSKNYDFPRARLARIETEAAHPDGERVQDTLRRETLTRLFTTAINPMDDAGEVLKSTALDAFEEDAQLVRDAFEIAQAKVEAGDE